ncbi:MAG: hypothetical protein Q8O67_19040 [Deltaproteobacteria bacterium]|nr:hypothetical protein [Deltaproteobacteria bacterium]
MRHIVVTCLVSLFSVASHADGDVFAILPTEGNGGVTSEAEMATQLMTIALQEQSLALVPPATVREAAILHEATCGQSPVACARLVGPAVGATKVIASELWDQAGALELRLVVVDVRAGVEPGPWQSFQAKDKAALGVVAQQAVLSLVVPDAFSGSLGISMEPGAEILVDGVARDRTPLVSALKLPVGRHEIEVRYGNAAPWRGFVEVAMEKSQELRLCVKAKAVVDDCGPVKGDGMDPLLVGGLAGAGLGAAGLVTGTVSLMMKNQAFNDFEERGRADSSNAIGPLQAVAVAGLGIGTILLVGGAAVAATSMIIE